jgi:hypothetical protein
VLAGQASPALLDTYQAERRAVDQHNAQRSLENAAGHFGIGAALGISHESTPEQNMEQLRRMWSGRPEDAGHRSSVLRMMRAQSMEFSELNVEFGYCYQFAAVVPDGSAAPPPADEIRVYQPSTRPGAPLPHAWIDDQDGRRRPVKDLVAPGRFLLIAGEDGQAWCKAARQLAAEADVPLDALRIGHLDGQPAKPDARGGDAHRRRIGYSQSCYKLSAMMTDSLRWMLSKQMLSNNRQAAAAVGLGQAWPLRCQVDSRRRSDGRGGTGSRRAEGVAAGPA